MHNKIDISATLKKVIIAVIFITLSLPLLGCEEITDLTQGVTTSSSQSDLKIVRSVALGADWQMKQISFKVAAGQEVAILLKLFDGDEADGFFYLEKGSNADFQIIGDSPIYQSEAEDTPSGEVDSDRFSLVASQEQGTSYTLIFHNPADNGKITIFLEIIYPVTGSLFVPVETK